MSGGERFQQERDEPAIGKSVAVILGSLAVFAVGVAISTWVLYAEAGGAIAERVTDARRLVVGRPEIGIVDQPLFETDHRTSGHLRVEARRLAEYGWIDRKSGVIHIPIERAIELWSQEAAK